MAITTMKLADLHVTPLLQPRAEGVSRETVQQYAADIRRGDAFPALVAYRVTDRAFPKPALVSGFHTREALAEAGRDEHTVEMREGTFADAWLAGVLSNRRHGRPYTNADKRKNAETALKLYRGDSAAVIAERLLVSDEFVRKVRKELVTAGVLEAEATVRGLDGREQAAAKRPSNEQPTQVPTVGTCDKQESERDAEDTHAPHPARSYAEHVRGHPGKPLLVRVGHPIPGATPVRAEKGREDVPPSGRPGSITPLGSGRDSEDHRPDRSANSGEGASTGSEAAGEPVKSFGEWHASLTGRRRRPKDFKPGNKVDPDHPFFDVLCALSSAARAITVAIAKDESGRLKKALTDVYMSHARMAQLIAHRELTRNGKHYDAQFIGFSRVLKNASVPSARCCFRPPAHLIPGRVCLPAITLRRPSGRLQ